MKKGVSSFLTCRNHFQRSGSVLTEFFNVTRFILPASLLLKNSRVCRKESPIFVLTFARIML